MHAPAGRPVQSLHVRRRDQRRENPPHARHEVAAQLAAVIVSNEVQQALVPDTPNVHPYQLYAKTVQLSRERSGVVMRLAAPVNQKSAVWALWKITVAPLRKIHAIAKFSRGVVSTGFHLHARRSNLTASWVRPQWLSCRECG